MNDEEMIEETVSDDENVEITVEEIEETENDIETEPEIPEETEISDPEVEIPTETVEKPSRIGEFEQKEALDNEYDEFKRLFPGVSVRDLPDAVRESVNSGVPLAAAYALFEKRRAAELADAENVNLRNREFSTGSVKETASNEVYYSPREVREMTPDEVHNNFSAILKSMDHWKTYTEN